MHSESVEQSLDTALDGDCGIALAEGEFRAR